MKTLKLTVVALFTLIFALSALSHRTVHSQSQKTATAAVIGVDPGPTPTPDTTATPDPNPSPDQANFAATGDATVTDGSTVDLEGVPANDTSTFTYSTTDDPKAATSTGATPAASGTTATAATTNAAPACPTPSPTPAPAAFDNKTNGLIPQGTPVPPGVDPTPGTFEADKVIFSQVDEIKDGLGPVYNAQSCRECHQNPVTGAISQITEFRAGHNAKDAYGNVIFVDAPGGSLINDRATDRRIQERRPPLYTASAVSGPSLPNDEPVSTFRTSLNTLGDGFVEAIPDGSIIAIANNQPVQSGGEVHGQAIAVPVLEANNALRVARFGWKDQHASLLSFSGDAYLNEIGITNHLILKENTSLGRFVGFGTVFDPVADTAPNGEDQGRDIDVFAEFMRATKAPPRNQDVINKFTADVTAGAQLFASMPSPNGPLISCSICHVPSIVTAKPCTPINGNTFTVPVALGNKIIRPFSDFLLHDVGTGDGITQNGGPSTRLKVRTPPLWGVSTRDRLMHDGEAQTFREAILRHAGEATSVINSFKQLSETQKRQLIIFLESL
jgi:CxxC motif-containing protein (DUF1111 family)